MGKRIYYDVYRKGSGDKIGVVDRKGSPIESGALGFDLLVDQIHRGVASEEPLIVLRRGCSQKRDITTLKKLRSAKVGL